MMVVGHHLQIGVTWSMTSVYGLLTGAKIRWETRFDQRIENCFTLHTRWK